MFLGPAQDPACLRSHEAQHESGKNMWIWRQHAAVVVKSMQRLAMASTWNHVACRCWCTQASRKNLSVKPSYISLNQLAQTTITALSNAARALSTHRCGLTAKAVDTP